MSNQITIMLQKWVTDNGQLSITEKMMMANEILENGMVSQYPILERVSTEDVEYWKNDIIQFKLPASFTRVELSKAKAAGQISVGYTSRSLFRIEGQAIGYDIDFRMLSGVAVDFALNEKETIVAGAYRVTNVEKIEVFGYEIPMYTLSPIN